MRSRTIGIIVQTIFFITGVAMLLEFFFGDFIYGFGFSVVSMFGFILSEGLKNQ